MLRIAAASIAALLLSACSSPRLDDATLVSITRATSEEVARWEAAKLIDPIFYVRQPKIDWPVLRVVFRSHRNLIEDGTSSDTIALLCGSSLETGYIGSSQLMWRGEFLKHSNAADFKKALEQSHAEEFEFFTTYTYRAPDSFTPTSQTVTILPLPDDVCLRRTGAYYKLSAGLPLRIDRMRIIDALKPLPRTLEVQR